MAEEREGHVGELIDRRVQVYGNPIETFARIAQVWSGILGHEVQPVEVPLLMAGMKMVRTQVMPDYSDNSEDIDGYMDIFRQLVGEDMIHARTVNEFIEKKWPQLVPRDERPKDIVQSGPRIVHVDGSSCIRDERGIHIVVENRHGQFDNVGQRCPNHES